MTKWLVLISENFIKIEEIIREKSFLCKKENDRKFSNSEMILFLLISASVELKKKTKKKTAEVYF